MKLTLFRPTWGVTRPIGPWLSELFAVNLYGGIEAGLVWLPEAEKKALREGIEEYKLEFIGMVFTDLPFDERSSVDDHIATFRKQVEELLPYRPKLINVHGGKDSWDEPTRMRYFTEVLAMAKDLDCPVAHETHRGRILYNPWTTRSLLETFPSLNLTADLSHWVTVAERLLSDDDISLSLIASRTIHIHARIGHEQGPQVTDPRAGEWSTHKKHFEHWWSAIWESQRARGVNDSTVTPEYGPTPYLTSLPHTRMPMVDLDEVTNWAANEIRVSFEAMRQGTVLSFHQ